MKKKQWIRAAAFLALLAAAFALLSPVFTPKDELGNIQEEPANSLDYLAIGDSECYTSISPMQLWGDYGYVGYNCGLASQRIQDAYYRLKKTLECQTPRLVLLETNMTCARSSGLCAGGAGAGHAARLLCAGFVGG